MGVLKAKHWMQWVWEVLYSKKKVVRWYSIIYYTQLQCPFSGDQMHLNGAEKVVLDMNVVYFYCWKTVFVRFVLKWLKFSFFRLSKSICSSGIFDGWMQGWFIQVGPRDKKRALNKRRPCFGLKMSDVTIMNILEMFAVQLLGLQH